MIYHSRTKFPRESTVVATSSDLGASVAPRWTGAAISSEDFKYDPLGRRIEKITPTGTTVYAYDGDDVVEELDGGGNPLAHYTQGIGIDEPLAMYRGLTISYFHADGLGSTTSLTDGAGQLAASYVYDSFGKLTASTGSITNPIQYTAREFDSETGLYYYRARYYDSGTGRFLSEDPIGFRAGVNFYVYGKNSPVNLKDPSGQTIVVQGDQISYLIARAHLSTSAAAESIIRDLETAPEVYIVVALDTVAQDYQDGWKVFWNPHKGLCVKHGLQSPAIQLLHELTHLWQWRHNLQNDLEEAGTQMTNPAARQLNEPTRVNYPDAHGNPMTLLPIPSGSKQEACECKGATK